MAGADGTQEPLYYRWDRDAARCTTVYWCPDLPEALLYIRDGEWVNDPDACRERVIAWVHKLRHYRQHERNAPLDTGRLYGTGGSDGTG